MCTLEGASFSEEDGTLAVFPVTSLEALCSKHVSRRLCHHLPIICCCARRHDWPQWQAQDLSRVFPSLEPEGVDLMRQMLQYDPARRISVSILT